METWITRIMINQALTHLKRARNQYEHVNVDDVANELEDKGGEKTSQNLSGKDLVKIIQQLPEGYRVVFNLMQLKVIRTKKLAGDAGDIGEYFEVTV